MEAKIVIIGIVALTFVGLVWPKQTYIGRLVVILLAFTFGPLAYRFVLTGNESLIWEAGFRVALLGLITVAALVTYRLQSSPSCSCSMDNNSPGKVGGPMQVSEFEIGKTYAITTKDWAAPDGSGTVPGKSMTITVLQAQELGEALSFDGVEVTQATAVEVEARKSFLRVKRENGKVHLLHPETIASSSLVH